MTCLFKQIFVVTILYTDDTTFVNVYKHTNELNNIVSVNSFLLNEDYTHNVMFSLRKFDKNILILIELIV